MSSVKLFTHNFQKPQPVPLLFIIVVTIALVSLGTWQMERLRWKNNLIEQVELAQKLPSLDSLPENLSGLEYRRINLKGTFKYEHVLHLIGRQSGNFPGYFMLTPFEVSGDGRIILVNRGFAPSNMESKPDGLQTVYGTVRPPRNKRFFAPENLPEKNIWFYEDIKAMSQATALPLSPLIVEEAGKTEKGVFPIKSDGKINLSNDHLGYAITWFATAIIGLVMFVVYHRKTEK